MGLSGVIAQHELPITGVSKQKPAGHSLVQVGGDWTTGAQSTSSFSVQTWPLVSMGTLSKAGDGPWSGKGAGQQKREGVERKQNLPGPLAGLCGHSPSQTRSFPFGVTRQLVRGKEKLWNRADGPPAAPNISCRLCRAAGTHSYAHTHNPAHMCSNSPHICSHTHIHMQSHVFPLTHM